MSMNVILIGYNREDGLTYSIFENADRNFFHFDIREFIAIEFGYDGKDDYYHENKNCLEVYERDKIVFDDTSVMYTAEVMK